MNYKALLDYIQDTVEGVDNSVNFYHGNLTNAQQLSKTENVQVWLLPMTSSGTFVSTSMQINEQYSINMFIVQQDRADSGINRNTATSGMKSGTVDILEYTSKLTGSILRLLNDNTINATLLEASDKIRIQSFNTTPEIKQTSALVTGISLQAVIQVQDNFDYCCL